MNKILLAYNPVSGIANFRKNLDEIIEKFQRQNILLTLYRTRAGNFFGEFIDCVKISEVEGVIAASGDGTLHTVINYLKFCIKTIW